MYVDFIDALAMAGIITEPDVTANSNEAREKGGGSFLSEE
jgi:hypothetical protein